MYSDIPPEPITSCKSILGWCWPSVADTGQTLNHHCVKVSFMLGLFSKAVKNWSETNVGLMLGMCRRHWPNTKPALRQRGTSLKRCEKHVIGCDARSRPMKCLRFCHFFQSSDPAWPLEQAPGADPSLFYCWTRVANGGPTIKQQWGNWVNFWCWLSLWPCSPMSIGKTLRFILPQSPPT